MSDIQKPVEPVVAAPTTSEPLVAADPATELPKTEEPKNETLSAEQAAAQPETAATTTEVAAETKPIEEGVLGYKAPGLIKSLRFSKKFFWFGYEAIETKNLSSYLRGEKPELANHNAAWSSQTGKGLLYFSKAFSEKASPAGIINLADISDVSEDGTTDFVFHHHGQKHTFQASTVAERDSWVAAIKAKSAEATESKESIIGSEGYKTSHSALSKPAAAAAKPKEAEKEAKEADKEAEKEVKEADKAEKKEEQAEAKIEDAEEKKETAENKVKDRKSRSQSRKRASIFAGLLNKKDEHEVKKEDKVIEKEEKKAEEAALAAAEATEAPVETAVPTEAVVEETAPVAAPAPERPTATKRTSVFGSFFAKKKLETEAAAPQVPPKDTVSEPITSENAPVLPEPESSEPLAASVASPATAPVENTTVVTAGEPVNGATESKELSKTEKRKSTLPFFGQKKEKIGTSDSEAEKPLSPFAKLRQTVKKASSPKTEKSQKEAFETKEEQSVAELPKTEEQAAAELPKTEEQAVAEPAAESAPVVQTTPQVSATA